MRKTAISSGVIGLVLLIVAGLMAWWITPSYIARMPSNYDKTRTYDATIRTLFNPAALATGNLAGAIKTGLPATISETVKVQQTSGNTALVQDTRNITVAGAAVGQTVSPYALDRQSLEATSSHPASWSVIPAQGLTVSWPLGAKQQNYTGWVYQTDTTTTLRYVKQVQQGGINTYEYQATVAPTLIKNPQLLASLPKSLPVSLLPSLRAAGLLLADAPGQPGQGIPWRHGSSARLHLSVGQRLLRGARHRAGRERQQQRERDGRHRATRREGHPGAARPGVHLPRHPGQPVGRSERRQQRQQRDLDLGSDRADHRGGSWLPAHGPRRLPVDARRQQRPPDWDDSP